MMTRRHLLFGFSGRMSRSQFWICLLGMLALTIMMLALSAGLWDALGTNGIFHAVWGVFSVLICWSSFALYAKRLHDHDKSLWWILMNLIPIFGQIWLIIALGFIAGSPGVNRYGAPEVKAADPWPGDESKKQEKKRRSPSAVEPLSILRKSGIFLIRTVLTFPYLHPMFSVASGPPLHAQTESSLDGSHHLVTSMNLANC